MTTLAQKQRGRKKLTQSQIEEVRAAKGLQVDIAIRFGITQAQVSRIKKGIRRK
jgi:transcriptional regulator with XRE-family HTH domain